LKETGDYRFEIRARRLAGLKLLSHAVNHRGCEFSRREKHLHFFPQIEMGTSLINIERFPIGPGHAIQPTLDIPFRIRADISDGTAPPLRVPGEDKAVTDEPRRANRYGIGAALVHLLMRKVGAVSEIIYMSAHHRYFTSVVIYFTRRGIGNPENFFLYFP